MFPDISTTQDDFAGGPKVPNRLYPGEKISGSLFDIEIDISI